MWQFLGHAGNACTRHCLGVLVFSLHSNWFRDITQTLCYKESHGNANHIVVLSKEGLGHIWNVAIVCCVFTDYVWNKFALSTFFTDDKNFRNQRICLWAELNQKSCTHLEFAADKFNFKSPSGCRQGHWME
jgi:hypothetical protein